MAEDECGEVFYGWAPKGVWHLDFSVPRRCDLPAGHRGGHDFTPPAQRTPEADQ